MKKENGLFSFVALPFWNEGHAKNYDETANFRPHGLKKAASLLQEMVVWNWNAVSKLNWDLKTDQIMWQDETWNRVQLGTVGWTTNEQFYDVRRKSSFLIPFKAPVKIWEDRTVSLTVLTILTCAEMRSTWILWGSSDQELAATVFRSLHLKRTVFERNLFVVDISWRKRCNKLLHYNSKTHLSKKVHVVLVVDFRTTHENRRLYKCFHLERMARRKFWSQKREEVNKGREKRKENRKEKEETKGKS